MTKERNNGMSIDKEEVRQQQLWQPFPLEVLPSNLQCYVKQQSEALDIDPANTAVCVLSILSGIIGRTYKIKIKRDYQECAMLWMAMVADSGYGKSPALNKTREPLDRLEEEALERYEKDYANLVSQPHSRKNKTVAEQTKKQTAPTLSRYIVSDTTTAALLPILAENPCGVCLIRDELAAFFGRIDKTKMDRQIYIEIHGGGFVKVDRRTGKRYLAAKTPSLSIIGGIQSDMLCETITREPDFMATGFGSRFLMVYPPSVPIKWNRKFVDEDVQSSYEQLIKRLIQNRNSINPDDPDIVRLSFSADRLIFDFQNRQADEVPHIKDDNVRYVFNKAGMHAARLALVLHVVECFERKFMLPSSVSKDTMRRAIVLTEWFLNESHRIYALLSGREESVDKEAEIILAKIYKHGGKVTAHDLRHGTKKYHQRGGTQSLKEKLAKMVEAGQIDRLLETDEQGEEVEYLTIHGNMVHKT